ncbi:MAG: PEGA domain-containing protein [Myxococcales bacterium]|nr:PEGA domain-containing protein [Myxococcales bacterium]
MVKRVGSIWALVLLLGAPAAASENWKQANAAYRNKDYATALTLLRALQAEPTPFDDPATLSFLLARCLDNLGQAPAAVDEYETFLKLASAHPAPTQRAQADQDLRVQNVRSRLVVLVPATFGGLMVNCADTGLTVALGEEARPCPATFGRRLPGPLTLTIRHEAQVIETRAVEIRPGPPRALEVAAYGRLRVTSDVPGAVTVDGRAMGSTPVEALWLAPGAHALRFEASGLPAETRMVTLTAGALETVALTVRPAAPAPAPVVEDKPPPPPPDRLLPWTVTGIAGAFAVAGAVTLVVASGTEDDADALHAKYEAATDPNEASRLRQQAESKYEDRDLQRGLGLGFLGAAVVAGGAATWLWLSDSPPQTATVAISPGGTVWLSGCW